MQAGFSTISFIITWLAIIAGLIIGGSFYIRNVNRHRPIQVATPQPTSKGVKGVTVSQSVSPALTVTPPRPVSTAQTPFSMQPERITQSQTTIFPSPTSVQIEAQPAVQSIQAELKLPQPQLTQPPLQMQPDQKVEIITGSPKPSPKTDFYQCSQDDDCIRVDESLCAQRMIAINKKYEQEWYYQLNPQRRIIYCTQVMCDDWTCTRSQPECIQNLCQLVETLPVPRTPTPTPTSDAQQSSPSE